MRPHSPWLRPLAVLFILLSVLGPASGAAPLRPSTESIESITSLLSQGSSLERSRQWAKAIAVYEEGLERWPGDRVLEQRLEQCKSRFQLARRYSDTSFRTQLLTLSREQALRLYNETLLTLQTKYVDPLSLHQLVRHGTENLKRALEDPQFVRVNLSGRSQQNIQRFRNELDRQVAPLPIANRRDAHNAVRRASDLGRTWVGMAAGPVVMEYVYGACEALDAHSAFLTPDQNADLYSQINGNFVGLGVELRKDDDDLLIVRVLPDSPAQEGGLRAGDVIAAVEGQATAPLTLDIAANRLAGREGSIVTIQVRSPGAAAARSLTLRRRAVDVKSIDESRIVDRDYGIAYIQMSGFQKSTAAELSAALWSLHRQGMRFLILDLRGNPGGLLTSAVEVSDRFVRRGAVVSTRGRSAGQNWSYPAHEAGTWSVPLAVLVDEDSASASEIVAACIRDNRRGKIVGRKTYGKGSVQSIYDFQSVAGGLRLTTAKFFSPNGRALEKVGVEPDVPVQRTAYRGFEPPGDGQENTSSADPDLNAALRVARQQMARRQPVAQPFRSSFRNPRPLPSR